MSILEKEAKRILNQIKFVQPKKIYQADCAQKGGVRNIIYSGKYKSREAIFKIYDDHRITCEPLALTAFNKINKSKILIAPALFDYQILNSKKGWLVMEKMPGSAKSFSSPMRDKERKEFLKLFLEYKRYFPARPNRDLLLAENLPAGKFHLSRMNKWFLLAHNNFSEAKKPELNPKEFIPRFVKAIELVDKEFRHRPKVLIHGHFKPQEIFKVDENKYYLTDFAHTAYYPEGYELAFMIWADWLLRANWKLNYSEWRKGIFSWIEDLQPIARRMGIKNYERLIRASIIERIIGTITADIFITNMPRQEKISRIKLLYKLFDELIK